MTVDEAAGLFGPGSMAWRVDRELMVLGGGSCALLMQAAHPVVAAGVVEHSTYATDPVGRLLRTLASSFDVVFGSRSRAEAAIRRVNAIHGAVRGELPGGGTYSARDPEALLWVHATLIDTALRVYGRFIEPLTPAEEQAYHEEATQVAAMLGVPDSSMPPTIDELREWMGDLVGTGRVRVTPAAREIARTVLYPSRLVPRRVWDVAHLVSLAMLPDELRRQYGVGWSARREGGMDRIAAVTRRALPLLPAPIRLAPAYRAAVRRVGQTRSTR